MPIASAAAKKSVTESRLQIRPEGIGGGRHQPIVKTYALETTLFEIAQSLSSSDIPDLNPELAVFSLTYPRKRYAGEDLQRTIRELGLFCILSRFFSNNRDRLISSTHLNNVIGNNVY